MSATHKNGDPESAAGHQISTTGVGLKYAIDCHVCKYGTLVEKGALADDKRRIMVCEDCGKMWSVETLKRLGKLPRSF